MHYSYNKRLFRSTEHLRQGEKNNILFILATKWDYRSEHVT